jgi:hypothetical protein
MRLRRKDIECTRGLHMVSLRLSPFLGSLHSNYLNSSVDKDGYSAPNYLDAYQNKAAVIIYDQKLTVRQFTHQPHPYWLPNFMDAFTWTLPFVAQKVADMFHGLLSTISTDEMEEEEARAEDLQAEEIAARRMRIKQKIRDVGKMSRVFAVLREESERVSELKGDGAHAEDYSDHLLMQGLLELGSEGIRKAIKDFDGACVLYIWSQLETDAQLGAARTLTMNGYRITCSRSWTMGPATTLLTVQPLLVPVADNAAWNTLSSSFVKRWMRTVSSCNGLPPSSLYLCRFR